jgi:K+-sensing histidine kinase KdpD
MRSEDVALRRTVLSAIHRDTPAARYGIALLITLISMASRAALDPWLGPTMPFITYYPGVMATVLLAGRGPALAAGAAAGVAAWYASLEPWQRLLTPESAGIFGLATFAAMTCAIAVIGGWFRDAARRSASLLANARRLHTIGARLAASQSVEEVGAAVASSARELFGVGVVGLYELDEGQRMLRRVYLDGVPPEIVERWSSISVDAATMSAEAFRTRAPVVAQNIDQWAQAFRRANATSGSADCSRSSRCH